jgi:seryl-tRNA(Sec) selenium transferase
MSEAQIPVVKAEAEIAALAGKKAYIEGTYEQEDVRMMRVKPETLFAGHAVVVLEDGCRVFLYPPAQSEARRSKQEIKRFEHKKVRALGVILPTIPQDGAVQKAPCLVEIESIALAGSA